MAKSKTNLTRSATLNRLFQMRDEVGFLSDEQEKKQLRLAQGGDTHSVEIIICNHIPFISKMAGSFAGNPQEKEDYIQAGITGLIKAIKRFDESFGFKFLSYAVWWIRQAMLEEQHQISSQVRYSITMRSQRKKINQTRQALEATLGRPASDEEVAHSLKMPIEVYRDIISATRQAQSLDAPFIDSDSSLVDVIKARVHDNPERTRVLEKLRKILSQVMDCLNDQEQGIIKLWVGWDQEPLHSKEIEKIIGLKYEELRKRRVLALRKLRLAIQDAGLTVQLQNALIPFHDFPEEFEH